MSDPQSSYFAHLNQLAETLQALILAEDLGPAGGRLHMQLCDLFTAHAALLEEQTRESIEKRRRDSGGDQEKDTGSEGDRPSDPES